MTSSGPEHPQDVGASDASFDYVARTPDEASEDLGEEAEEDETVLIDGWALRLGSLPVGPPVPGPPSAVPAPTSPAAPAAVGLRALFGPGRRPRARLGTRLGIAVLLGLLGFFAVVQVRSQNGDSTLRSARQSDLIRILDDLNDRSDRLEGEIRDLDTRRTELQSGTDSSKAALAEASRRKSVLGILAGTVPAHGPGITLRIVDPQKKVDSAVLLDTLEELRDAGAEAVQLNGVRVVASTALVDAEPGSVRVDSQLVTAPYVLKVIGDPDTLDPALRIPGGVFAVLGERGATPTVSAADQVVVDATRPAENQQYSRPAPAGSN
ncbi:MAG TPA: DUF881 domain-containing protein [Sporichthyaceae bacterium]|nr:DUF881 domain-containing protein [Sporichthyaceae bacterium]